MYAYMKKNEKKVRLRRQLMIILAGIVAAIAIIFVGGSRLRSHQVQASGIYSETTCTTIYKSVYVNAGDTLWSIADTYMDDSYKDKSDFIEEIREINHISEKSLQAGSYIIVPYHTTE